MPYPQMTHRLNPPRGPHLAALIRPRESTREAARVAARELSIGHRSDTERSLTRQAA
ncbi:hypothetical protein FAGKG844_440015 [Frankia sp. AgKG'84/4]